MNSDASGAGTRWEHFPHDADVGMHGIGSTPAQAFEQAALALTAVVTDPVTVAELESAAFDCAAPDLELLLVDWLNAVIYEMAIRQLLFARYQVTIDGDHLRGRAWGETVDVERHRPVVEPKGATYTALKVGQEADGLWHARCVVDV
ncbi:MAG: archease [Gammaproteobacteria bacterium]|jgi:SHS2 domain-containing protein|nr:archease [Gammaproteobacteria bacterium]